MNAPTPYAWPRAHAAIELDLARNEGRLPRSGIAAGQAALAARYPSTDELQALLAARHRLAPAQVLVTAGGDDALLRCCLAFAHGGEVVLPTPSFEMLERYVAIARGRTIAVDWPDGAFPVDAVLAAASPRTALVFVVSPNNPTGAVATRRDLERLRAALPGVVLVLDAAYAEFADDDLTDTALALGAIVVRTLSKAWSLAGLRIGCALAEPATIARLAAAGNPLPVAGPSLAAAITRLQQGEDDVADHVAAVRAERATLASWLAGLGIAVAAPAQGNFLLARGLDAAFVAAAAAALGVGLRHWPQRPELADAVRIGLPGEPQAFARLQRTLQAVLAPEALLLDVDGVLVDVGASYRDAIATTAAGFGVVVTAADIAAAKARGDANDDWALTHALVAAAGVPCSRAEIIERFERRYAAVRDRESLLLDAATLSALARHHRLGLVTGRPRRDLDHLLDRFALRGCFAATVCREDAPLKPDPAPVCLAMQQLHAATGWMLGDTVDDIRAARGAGVVPLGVAAPGADLPATRDLLTAAGAAAVLPTTSHLPSLLRVRT